MQFRSIADLQRTIVHNMHRLPPDIDLVVGIPRSGLLVATLIALHLNLPLTDVEGFAAGRLIASGRTRRRAALDIDVRDARCVLVVDDSVRTGRSMHEARARLAAVAGDARLVFCAAYGTPDPRGGVDLAMEIVAEPRVFEWNVMHHVVLTQACVDIDGVLCHDPVRAENDDGARYRGFLADARPLHMPTREIAVLVTSRLERYRAETEDWLSRTGIRYGKLAMLDLPDGETRRRLRAGVAFKADFYRASDTALFIESERHQAIEIAALAGKPVLWMGGPELMRPGRLSATRMTQTIRRSSGVRRIARSLLGATLYDRMKNAVARPA